MQDGYIVYQGEAAKSTQYFADLGYKMSKFGNPADFFMRILSVNYPKSQEDEEKVNRMLTAY